MPTVTGILLCYNCEDFVADALRSALAQSCDEPIEILVSDDASTDATFPIVRDVLSGYDGPHRTRLLRRGTNSGSKSAHLNDVFPRARGDILVSFDGDDVSESGRVRKIIDRFQADPSLHGVYSSYSVIDPQGRPRGTARVPHPPAGRSARQWFARVDAYAAGTTLAVRREVVERFPPLDPDIHEDIVLPFRASLLGGVAYLPEPLVRARRHAASLTADLEQFASLDAYRERMRLGIARARRNVASRLEDLATARRLLPGREKEWEGLEGIVHASAAEAQWTEALTSPRLSVRLA
ncbi:MAG: glycosyltransferase, partial [Deferrisomatales bacterium]